MRRFLKCGWGVSARDLRVVPYPHGAGGAAERHVRQKYPNELTALRARHAKTILITVVDAADGTVRAHHEDLNRACREAQPAVGIRQPDEPVIHVIPKWHIETWLAYLDGIPVSEDEQYKASHAFAKCESECHPLVDGLATKCRNKEPLANPPSSLSQACTEFDRIRELLS